jgi:hypothetical protein
MRTSSKLVAYLGTLAISITIAPIAQGGCGRQVLPGLLSGAAALERPATASLSVEPRAAESAGYQAIVGLWLTTLTVGGQTFGVAFESFTSDGLEILNDNGAPQAGNVCLGVWAPTGRSTLKVNHPSWNYDNNGNVIGTVVIKSQITLEAGGNTYKGTAMIDVFDLNGNMVAPTTAGHLAATRIKP